jgi:O-antigen ligase
MLVRQKEVMRVPSASWQVWSASLLLAIMPLCFALSSRLKTVPMAALFVIGLVLLATQA